MALVAAAAAVATQPVPGSEGPHIPTAAAADAVNAVVGTGCGLDAATCTPTDASGQVTALPVPTTQLPQGAVTLVAWEDGMPVFYSPVAVVTKAIGEAYYGAGGVSLLGGDEDELLWTSAPPHSATELPN